MLKNKLARTKRKANYSGIEKVRNIAIVWDTSSIEDFACLSKFYQKMAESKTDVRIIGYFPGKSLPNQYTAIRYLSILKRDELNLFYHPVSSEVSSFVRNPFDVLIDLNFQKLLPLQYVSYLSNASLKVGLMDSESNNSPFDIMMDIPKPVTVDDYLKHVVHYLEMIKSESVN